MLDIAAFAALIKRKRGEMKLTQETLALDVFGDSARKADISRLENGRVSNPQEATVQKICTALNISEVEMEPIRNAQVSGAQLDHIPTLSREALQNLASRFQIEGAFDLGDEKLREILTLKADEYRALKAEVDAIPDQMKHLSNLKAAAKDAIDRVDLDEVEALMTLVHETELEEAAKSAEIRATNALLRGEAQQAFTLLKAAADSFASIAPDAPAERKILRYFKTLWDHGLRYGGAGLPLSQHLLQPELNDTLFNKNARLWAAGQNALAVTLRNQGTRTEGPDGSRLLDQAITAFRAALQIRTRKDHPLDWAMTQNNLANTLQIQGTRTERPDGAKLLNQSVTAFRAALEVYTRKDHPLNWAMTQNNLASTLQIQGIHTEGQDGARLLDQAVTAYRAALEVRTRKDHPVQWAMTQNNLANTLGDQGERTAGQDGAKLLDQAVSAYHAALEVYTRNDHPVHWASTQENIAINQLEIANHPTCDNPASALTAAKEAVENALTVFDPIHMSYNHAKATDLSKEVQSRLDALK